VGVFAQERTVRGTDEKGKPVAGADVLADFRPQTSLLTGKTDAQGIFKVNSTGAFKLSIISPSDSMIDFSGTYSAMDLHIVVSLKQKNMLINPVTIT